jgi:mono/diheme cytochrome c family protein
MEIDDLKLRFVSLLAGASLLAGPVFAQGKVTVVPAQATRGKAVYDQVCVSCHETLEYTGPDFRDKWNGRPIFDLYDLMRTTMPDDAPGTLTAQQYIDVVVYMMKLNGVAAGKNELPATADSLKKFKMEIPSLGARSANRRQPVRVAPLGRR